MPLTNKEMILSEAFQKLRKAKTLEIEAIDQYYSIFINDTSTDTPKSQPELRRFPAVPVSKNPVVENRTNETINDANVSPIRCSICHKEIHDQIHSIGNNAYMCDICYSKNVKVSAIQAVQAKEIKTNFVVNAPEVKEEVVIGTNEKVDVTEVSKEQPKEDKTKLTRLPAKQKSDKNDKTDKKKLAWCSNCRKFITGTIHDVDGGKFMCDVCYKASQKPIVKNLIKSEDKQETEKDKK